MNLELSATKFPYFCPRILELSESWIKCDKVPKTKWGKSSHIFSFWSWCENIWFLCGYCVLYLCYQYDRMYEQTVMLLGTAGRLVSHIMLRLMQLTRRRLYSLMTLTGETYKGSAQIPGVSLCGGTPAWQRHCHCACISVVPSKDATPFILPVSARLVKIRAPQAIFFMF